ncbi:MAG: hypothetical protein DCC88_01245 [Spirobacillus cienkowskii]|jgi:hypothetical protein|uniref:Uncharacterized protein n=1 Tax=Spirobacillus cienkowskii TaxID=495820 RepID=A0A369KRE7_9BACT|nr:MAG: hypothetical protein DCC88_01245 [Spirobacillus cienkowskii]
MNTTQNSAKKILKKFNLIFFIDSEKTYHFKFKYIYVKIFIIFVFTLLLSAIVSIVISVKVINKNIELENYIVEFKKNILKSYFTKGFYKEDKKRNSESMMEETISKPQTQVSISEKNSKDIKYIENSGIKIENHKVVQDTNSTKISFSFSNSNHEKNSILGAVCAVIIGLDEAGNKKIIKIPDNLIVNSQNIPSSCLGGELVRFSRLRPTEFNIDFGKNNFKIEKVNIYFSFTDTPGVVVNSF